MYFTPGANANEIGDFEIVEHDGRLHCFYLCLPSHDQIGHLISDDGLHWEPLPPALRTGHPGDFDEDQIWTMGVFRKGDLWFMLYTALAKRGLVQTVGLASSNNLLDWTKHPANPVLSPDGRWYESEQHGNFRIDWRDPHVIEHDGILHGVLTARRQDGLLNHRGCAAYFSSRDGYQWEVHPPASNPAGCFDFECPSVFQLDGRFYMVAIAGGQDRAVYRLANQVSGPYLRPQDDTLLPEGNLSVRPCTFQGQVHLFHWQRGLRDWGHVNEGYAMLASPKTVRAEADGSLIISSSNWSSQYSGGSIPLAAGDGRAVQGRWTKDRDSLLGVADEGLSLWLSDASYEDFLYETEIIIPADQPAREFGVVLRAESDGDCAQFVSIAPGRLSVELIDYRLNRPHGPDSLWRGRTVKQRHHLQPAADGKYHFKIIAYGPSLEINVNGRLVLATMSLPRRNGQVGFFLEDGAGAFQSSTIQPLRAPTCNWEWR